MIGAIGFDTGEFDELMQRLRLLTDRVNQRRGVLLRRTRRTGREPRRPTRDGPTPKKGMATRTARTAWNGTLQDGSGRSDRQLRAWAPSTSPGPKRTAEDADGTTSPRS